MGIQADGTAPMKGSGNTDCDNDSCTWASVTVKNGTLYLQGLHVIVPDELIFEAGGNALSLDDFRFSIDHPEGTVVDPKTGAFSFDPGSVKAIAAGNLYGVPMFTEIVNSTPLGGMVQQAEAGESATISFEPVTFGYVDPLGNDWSLLLEFGAMTPQQRAPDAYFEVEQVDGALKLDGTASSDPDGDALEFTWYVDGTEVGDGAKLSMQWDPDAMHIVVLRVVDETGRDDWTLRLLNDDQ